MIGDKRNYLALVSSFGGFLTYGLFTCGEFKGRQTILKRNDNGGPDILTRPKSHSVVKTLLLHVGGPNVNSSSFKQQTDKVKDAEQVTKYYKLDPSHFYSVSSSTLCSNGDDPLPSQSSHAMLLI